MAAASRKPRSAAIGSLSSTPRFCNSHSPSSSSSAFASSTSSFTSRSSTFFHRSSSPTRVNLYGSTAPSVRFSLDRSVSPNRSISVTPRTGASRQSGSPHQQQKRTCMCSPTTHPGSFRCSLHKKSHPPAPAPYSPHRLNARRSAMTNSLVRIRGVEGDLVKRALAALIRPSSHQQRRRGDFCPRPSRLSVMSKAERGNISLVGNWQVGEATRDMIRHNGIGWVEFQEQDKVLFRLECKTQCLSYNDVPLLLMESLRPGSCIPFPFHARDWMKI